MQAKMISSAKAKGGKEIPVPKVTSVPSYNTDYLPNFREQNTYIRGRGTTPSQIAFIDQCTCQTQSIPHCIASAEWGLC